MHKSLQKLSKHEKILLRKEKLKEAMRGEGRYIFQNNTSGELTLPKMPLEGKSLTVGVKQQFIGDSYFIQMVKTNELRLIEILEKEEPPMEKLITEQPPVVTDAGKVEFVTSDSKKKKLNETDVKKDDVLLTEDPMGGIVIVE